MTKIKLVDGSIINASGVELINGSLQISTTDLTVEELAELFSNKDNTNYIELLTENGEKCGFKTGFTSFAGITYGADGVKTVELFQPVDVTEARLSNVEGAVNSANAQTEATNQTVTDLEIALVEMYETMLGGV